MASEAGMFVWGGRKQIISSIFFVENASHGVKACNACNVVSCVCETFEPRRDHNYKTGRVGWFTLFVSCVLYVHSPIILLFVGVYACQPGVR